jgi:hypothetical protein
MANTLPNKITKTQAETAANETYNRVFELRDVYDNIASYAAAGAFTVTVTVSNSEVADYVKSELLLDGYTLSGDGTDITISWGEPPVIQQQQS